ncbi:YbaY family lipoprotein [Coralliovum pocilloporae]|uniref:YbaY family lipoprotein n=1 Tax=Coralliovum pocilloporae TaxID=3066369 RepID=UPI0033072421
MFRPLAFLLGTGLLVLSGCAPSFEIDRPPAARVGDGLLAVTIRTKAHRIIPARSRVVITIADTALADAPSKALAGDETTLRRADKSLRLSFPIDQASLELCKEEGRCSISVHIVKDGVLRFINDTHIPFKAGQKQVRVMVTKPG